MIHQENCPVCSSSSIHLLFPVKDHSISGEWFQLWECVSCTLRFTKDIPSPAEIGPYYASSDYISHSDTKQGIVNSLYHRVRQLTLKQKRKMIIKATGIRTGEILDIGCGTGSFLSFMRAAGWKVTGIEPDQGARKIAGTEHSIVPLPPDALFDLPENSFHAITLWHVLEHVHDLHKYMEKIRRLMAPGGRLLVAVPNYRSLDAAWYREFWAAYDVPRHLYHFSPPAMKKLLHDHGFECLDQKPMWFDSFYVSLLSEKYRSRGILKYIKAFILGAVSNLNALMNRDKCSSLIYIAGATASKRNS